MTHIDLALPVHLVNHSLHEYGSEQIDGYVKLL